MSIFSSVVFLHFLPSFSQIARKAATKKNVEVLVAPRVPMFDVAHCLHALKMFAIAGTITAENYDNAAVVLSRATEPVTLMITNCFRQTESRPEEIDRSRFAIIVCENRGARLFFGRKRFVNARGCFRHLAPAKFVREILRQGPGWLVLSLRWFDSEFLLKRDEISRRKNRRHGRRENECRSNEQY